jgi:hypothetical protein
MLNCHDRERRIVTMTQHYWETHIVDRRGSWINHESYLKAIKSTIYDPELVRYDKDHPEREVCYARPPMEHHPDYYMKVVIQYDGGQGFVVTAFPTDKPHPGEDHKWP